MRDNFCICDKVGLFPKNFLDCDPYIGARLGGTMSVDSRRRLRSDVLLSGVVFRHVFSDIVSYLISVNML